MILAGEGLGATVVNFIKDMCDKIGFTSAGQRFIALAIVGTAIVLLAFIIALLSTLGSKKKKETKKYKVAKEFLDTNGEITEENIEHLNPYIQDMSANISSGWGEFLASDSANDYPSDYMKAEKVFGSAKQEKSRTGKTFFAAVSMIGVLAVAFLGALLSRSEGVLDVLSAGTIIYLLFDIISVIVFPLIAFIVFSLILSAVNRGITKKSYKAYNEFISTLDDVVVISKEKPEEKTEEEVKVDEKIDLLDDEVQKIINSKIEQNELIEIVTTPRVRNVEEESEVVLPEIEKVQDPTDVSDVELKDDEFEEIPLPSTESLFDDDDNKTEKPQQQVQEERKEESQLQGLVALVEQAVADVKGTTKEDLTELAKAIKEAQTDGRFPDPRDQEILNECRYKILNLYYQ